mmetsp:Transcript_2370/g.6918  ORF Transcript_2370/g.6918 Transcript_2370/m.6918 type:complete len:245 (-) Transcript_2370:1103-1837(-)
MNFKSKLLDPGKNDNLPIFDIVMDLEGDRELFLLPEELLAVVPEVLDAEPFSVLTIPLENGLDSGDGAVVCHEAVLKICDDRRGIVFDIEGILEVCRAREEECAVDLVHCNVPDVRVMDDPARDGDLRAQVPGTKDGGEDHADAYTNGEVVHHGEDGHDHNNDAVAGPHAGELGEGCPMERIDHHHEEYAREPGNGKKFDHRRGNKDENKEKDARGRARETPSCAVHDVDGRLPDHGIASHGPK